MQTVKTEAAKGFRDAFAVENKTLQMRIYGSPDGDRLALKSKSFIKKRPGCKRGQNAVCGNVQIEMNTEEMGAVQSFQRAYDTENGIVTAETVFDNEKKYLVNTTAFAPKHKKVLAYELKTEQTILNLKVKWQSVSEGETYLKYHIGGFFATDTVPVAGGKLLLCLKAALYSNGYPKEEEDGLVIRNASRAAFYYLMDEVFVSDGESETQAMLNLQMKMNRYLVEVEDSSFEQLKID